MFDVNWLWIEIVDMKQNEGLAMLRRAITATARTDPEAAAFLADGLRLAATGAVATLDEGLGIRGRGIASLATRERLSRRDRHLRRAFALVPFNEDTSTPARIRELASEIGMFEASTWRWSRHHAQPPARLSPLQCELWFALSSAPAPTSATHLKRIIAEHQTPGFDG
jgi:hypothetical protein